MSDGSSGAPTQLLLSTSLSSQRLMPARSKATSMRCCASCSGGLGAGRPTRKLNVCWGLQCMPTQIHVCSQPPLSALMPGQTHVCGQPL